MATVDTPPTQVKPSSPVPLDTIPISPAKENHAQNTAAKDGANGSAKSGDEQITVFHDKDNFNVKHPLMNEWTLWFTKPPSGKVGFAGNLNITLLKDWETEERHRATIGTIFSRK